MKQAIFTTIAAAMLLSCSVNNQNNSGSMEPENKGTAWINHTNIYEVNLRQYTQEGTINAFSKELPRLKEMGVHTLWFMPITPIAQKNKKGSLGSYYAASDYTSINPEFGTMDDWKALVKQAHEMGFKVIIDWVANHTGWDHVWTKTNPEYYEKDPETKDFKKASGMDDIIELDFKNPALRRAMIDAMKFWVTETGIDGFRCDLAFWVELDFWVEAKKELEQIRPLFWLGELDPLDNPDYMQVFDAAYTWKFMHKAREFYQEKKTVSYLDSVLNEYQQLPGMQAWFTTNHDENSWNGTEYEKYGEAALPLAVFSCTWPGLPLIYSGQELPNQKRLEFFEKDVIQWNGQYQLHEFYKRLLNLHASHPALNGDDKVAPVQRLHTNADNEVLAYLRTKDDRKVLVLLNLSANEVNCQLPAGAVTGTFTNVFSGETINITEGQSLNLKPWQYLVFEH